MKYNLDLSKISTQTYKELLKKQRLLPGRRILWHDIDDNFEKIEDNGINDLYELKRALSSVKKILSFEEKSGINAEYLTILKRELGTLEQKPVSLTAFPEVDMALIAKLNSDGIKTSKGYFESKSSGPDELYCLCDLVRINGIGAAAARAFYEAGYQSLSDVAGANAGEMLEKVTAVNNSKHYYKAKLGEKDMQFCIDFASLIMSFAVE